MCAETFFNSFKKYCASLESDTPLKQLSFWTHFEPLICMMCKYGIFNENKFLLQSQLWFSHNHTPIENHSRNSVHYPL